MNQPLDLTERPAPDEAPQYFFQYIEKVPAGDIRDTLEAQGASTLEYLRAIPEERTLERYETGKWSVREVLGHINDTERVFVYRAFWFARGLGAALPGFDQDEAVSEAGSDTRSWESLIAEFEAVRSATTTLFRHLPAAAWSRKGVASERTVSVRALAFITAGHLEHHLRLLRERYALV
ncbi:MAG TPA: DinB family protein [Trueperaceae bacterium]